MHHRPTLWLVAGPNGVGKTTYALRHIRTVSGSVRFVNLDEIARGLSPLDPQAGRGEAARIALARIDALIRGNGTAVDFSIESTLAGLTYLRRFREAARQGWRIHLLYFAVRSPEEALARIARRVSEGGHDIPEPEARRRFARSVANLGRYIDIADLWRVFDNNGPQPRAVAEGRMGCLDYTGETGGLPDALRATLDALPRCPG